MADAFVDPWLTEEGGHIPHRKPSGVSIKALKEARRFNTAVRAKEYRERTPEAIIADNELATHMTTAPQAGNLIRLGTSAKDISTNLDRYPTSWFGVYFLDEGQLPISKNIVLEDASLNVRAKKRHGKDPSGKQKEQEKTLAHEITHRALDFMDKVLNDDQFEVTKQSGWWANLTDTRKYTLTKAKELLNKIGGARDEYIPGLSSYSADSRKRKFSPKYTLLDEAAGILLEEFSKRPEKRKKYGFKEGGFIKKTKDLSKGGRV
jgi:hypothetical protein|tara:strand:+ start:131 stop:919 length:789 start_codon:yes stop_codon:yes gene_type:complete